MITLIKPVLERTPKLLATRSWCLFHHRELNGDFLRLVIIEHTVMYPERLGQSLEKVILYVDTVIWGWRGGGGDHVQLDLETIRIPKMFPVALEKTLLTELDVHVEGWKHVLVRWNALLQRSQDRRDDLVERVRVKREIGIMLVYLRKMELKFIRHLPFVRGAKMHRFFFQKKRKSAYCPHKRIGRTAGYLHWQTRVGSRAYR